MNKPFIFFSLLVALVGFVGLPSSVQASPPEMPEQWRDHVGDGFDQWEPSAAQVRTMQRYWQRIFQGTMYVHVESFLQADQNADDRITLPEWRQARLRKMTRKNPDADPEAHIGSPDRQFERMDTNHDGFYDRAELRAVCQAHANAMLSRIAKQLMLHDKNRDGRILKQEQPSQFDLALAEANKKDANNDGQVTFEEHLGPRDPAKSDASWKRLRTYLKQQWREDFLAVAGQDSAALRVRDYAKIREPRYNAPRDIIISSDHSQGFTHFREFVRYGLGGDIAKPIREKQRTKHH